VRRVYNPDRIDPVTKQQGYSAAEVKGLSKDQKASFVEFEIVDDDTGTVPTVEAATAAPGEKRATTTKPKRTTTKK
jgi:hypothetical protein